MTTKPGWQGRVYEDFEVGDVYPHPLGRTVTQNDNIWFSLLTMNTNPIHFDSAYSAQTEWGTPLINSAGHEPGRAAGHHLQADGAGL